MNLNFDFVLNHDIPNIYGMHENGNVFIYLNAFGGIKKHIMINKLIDIIEHECIHFCIDDITEDIIEWQKQERIIGHMKRLSQC